MVKTYSASLIKKPELLNDILEVTKELIKIFLRVSKRPFDRLTALSGVEGLKRNRHSKQLNCGAERHHYSMFNVDDPVKSLLHNFVPLHAVLSYKELPAYCAQNIAIRLFTKLSTLDVRCSMFILSVFDVQSILRKAKHYEGVSVANFPAAPGGASCRETFWPKIFQVVRNTYSRQQYRCR